MKKRRLIWALLAALMLLTLCACADNKPQSELPITPSPQPDNNAAAEEPADVQGEFVISLEYERQSGSASNQYAVWIEDMDGNFIKTLYATRYTANGGYKTRPDSIAMWVEKSKLASMTKLEVDAISGATPQTGTQSYTWNLTDKDGKTVQPGEYKFFVEGTLRWKNHVVFSGIIELGEIPVTVSADAEFFYEATERQAALSGDSPESKMISAVTADFYPKR